MIYDIDSHKLNDLLKDERLISNIMASHEGMTTSEAKEKTQFAYEKCDGFSKPPPVKVGGEACTSCGSSDLARTGTCFACLTCGSSQWCS